MINELDKTIDGGMGTLGWPEKNVNEHDIFNDFIYNYIYIINFINFQFLNIKFAQNS